MDDGALDPRFVEEMADWCDATAGASWSQEDVLGSPLEVRAQSGQTDARGGTGSEGVRGGESREARKKRVRDEMERDMEKMMERVAALP